MEHQNKLLQFRAPKSLSEAIDAAAKRKLQTKSEYVRRSVIDRLRADGIGPSCMATGNGSVEAEVRDDNGLASALYSRSDFQIGRSCLTLQP